MAVISGVGVRGYYKRIGFQLKKPYGYMILYMNPVLSYISAFWILVCYALKKMFRL